MTEGLCKTESPIGKYCILHHPLSIQPYPMKKSQHRWSENNRWMPELVASIQFAFQYECATQQLAHAIHGHTTCSE
jgi:hypothetical protein